MPACLCTTRGPWPARLEAVFLCTASVRCGTACPPDRSRGIVGSLPVSLASASKPQLRPGQSPQDEMDPCGLSLPTTVLMALAQQALFAQKSTPKTTAAKVEPLSSIYSGKVAGIVTHHTLTLPIVGNDTCTHTHQCSHEMSQTDAGKSTHALRPHGGTKAHPRNARHIPDKLTALIKQHLSTFKTQPFSTVADTGS